MVRRAFLRLCCSLTLSERVFKSPLRSSMVQTSGRLVAFGDSITYGLGASAPECGYARMVATGVGMALDNRAVSGSHLAEQARQIAETALTPADQAIWLVGYNDMRAGVPLDVFRLGLDAALADLAGRAAGVWLGNCLRMTSEGYREPHGPYGSDAAVAAFNEVIAAAAAAAGPRVVLVDASRAYQPEHVTADLVHPNDDGHREIAGAFLGAVLRRHWQPLVLGGV